MSELISMQIRTRGLRGKGVKRSTLGPGRGKSKSLSHYAEVCRKKIPFGEISQDLYVKF